MSDTRAAVDEALLRRVRAEFLEMPGLRLTSRQAQRLWGLEESACLRLLEFLVDAGFLYRPGHGMYARLTDGYTARPQARMVKALIGEHSAPRKKEAV
jgi:hypothetical protein